MEVEIGRYIHRNNVTHPDDTDGFINLVKGSLFEITAIKDGYINVTCVASSNYPFPGNEMSIPTKWLTSQYFVLTDYRRQYPR